MMSKELIGKKVKLEGTASKITPVYLVCTEIIYICPNCGQELRIVQDEEKEKTPIICYACKHKFKFELKERITAEQQDFLFYDFESKEKIVVYLKEKELMNKFAKLSGQELKINGTIEAEFRKKSTRGDLILIAEEINEV